MPWTYRRSKRIAPGMRVNVGKRGGSVSLGGRGSGVNVGRRGLSSRMSLPGTGLSWRSKRQGCGLLFLVPPLLFLLLRGVG